MAKNWLTEIIEGWDAQIVWASEEIEHLSALLLSICENNDGVIYPDLKMSEKSIREYKTQRIESILNSFVARIVRRVFKQITPVFRAKSDKFVVNLPFIEPTEHSPRINLNLATAGELEKLPGIGPKTAARITSYRKANGYIKRISELKKVNGISNREISKFAHKVYLKRASESITVKSEFGDNLINNPTFQNYIAFQKNNDILISKYSKIPADIKELIVTEIEGIKNNLETGSRLHGLSPGIRASKLKEKLKENSKLKKYIEENSIEDTHAVLLRDSNYYYFTQKLLKTARKKIRLVMFFFMFLDEKNHPSDKFMKELVKAKERGVNVKVILDHQDEDDPKASSIINKGAFDYLRKNKIRVVFDTEEIATHTKLLLVDDKHVVVGSHNWTAGSFFVYRDTSVYINSGKLSDIYNSHFESLWKKYRKQSSRKK
jgi:competence ComEA-like helix-hairpin-helix protein